MGLVVKALLLAFMSVGPHWAGAQLPVPALTGRVIDQTATLTAPEIASLEATLLELEKRKGSQLAVLIVPSTGQEPIEQYALRVAEKWKLGRPKIDDGALMVVAKDDHTIRIEVGYGLEGVLPDASCHRIINEVIAPRFKQQDYAGGITSGLAQMIRLINGEALAAPPQDDELGQAKQLPPYALIIGLFALVMGGVFRALFGRLFGALTTGGLVALLAWWLGGTLAIALSAGLIALLFTLGSGLGLLPMGPGSGRSGGFGGMSGGGGRFGGGGASGRW